jgi:hypothetical protein
MFFSIFLLKNQKTRKTKIVTSKTRILGSKYGYNEALSHAKTRGAKKRGEGLKPSATPVKKETALHTSTASESMLQPSCKIFMTQKYDILTSMDKGIELIV